MAIYWLMKALSLLGQDTQTVDSIILRYFYQLNQYREVVATRGTIPIKNNNHECHCPIIIQGSINC